MSQQLDLFTSSQGSPQLANNCLFVAMLPDAEAVQRLMTVGTDLRNDLGLSGTVVDADRFHITLQYINHFSEVTESMIREVSQACETAARRGSSFEVTFDRALSFGKGATKRPVVLTADKGHETNAELRRLHQSLWLELKKTRVPIKGTSSLTPHITLLYDPQVVSERPVETIGWKVEEIVLIQSLQKEHTYHQLGRWRLGVS